MPALSDLALMIQSRYPFIAVDTAEEDRLEMTLAQVAGDLRVPFFVWTVTNGLHRYGLPNAIYDSQQPLKGLNNVAAMPGEAIFLMKDLHRYLADAPVVRKCLDLAPAFRHDRLVDRLRGFTAFEAERAITRAILRDNTLDAKDVDFIVELKKEMLRKDGVLEYVSPEENLAEVGGFTHLKAWLEKRKKAFTPEAKTFGLEPSRGILLLGVQGS